MNGGCVSSNIGRNAEARAIKVVDLESIMNTLLGEEVKAAWPSGASIISLLVEDFIPGHITE
jgi:hypothetical protein